MDYTRLLPDGDVNMKFLENQWATITCGRSRTRIAGMSRESFPELPQMPEPIAEIPVKAMAGMIARTSFAISMEESRFTLNGALFLIAPEGLTMVTTDSHRLSFVQSPLPEGVSGAKPFRTLIPRKAMTELVRLGDETPESKIALSDDDNHLFFFVGNRLLMTRKLTGNFPDYPRVLPKDHTLTAVMQRDEIKSAIERVAQFADERSRAIRVQFMPGEVKIFSQSVETGESEESVSSQYEGPNLEIGFNAQYLLDFLRAISQDQVAFHLKDQKSAGELRPVNENAADQYRYVVMPMRI